MKMKIKCRIAAFAAAVLLMLVCAVPVFATEGAGGRDETLVSQSQAEGVPEETEIEIEFFDDLQVNSGLRDTLFVIGAILAFAGAAGFVCMFLWKRANKRRDRTQETREGILDEIEQAEQRGRKQRIQKARKAKQEDAALKPEADADLFDTQENDAFTSKPVELVQETPIVPSTPVSMQPGEKPRPRVQAEPVRQPVQPITVRPVQPVEQKAAEAAPQAQVEAKPAEPRAQDLKDKKYDLDDILREIREGKL